MIVRNALKLFGVSLVAALFAGCGSDSDTENAADAVLTGQWHLSQATVNSMTLSTSAYGTAQLTLNADGTFQVVAQATGSDQNTYTGTYTVSGATIAFTAPGVPASAGVTMPVSATYTLGSDSLELQLSAPITVSGFTVSAIFLVR